MSGRKDAPVPRRPRNIVIYSDGTSLYEGFSAGTGTARETRELWTGQRSDDVETDSRQTCRVTCSLSPVSTFTATPRLARTVSASWAPAFGGSRKVRKPAKVVGDVCMLAVRFNLPPRDPLVVIIFDLHNLVAGREYPAESFDLAFNGGRKPARLTTMVSWRPSAFYWAPRSKCRRRKGKAPGSTHSLLSLECPKMCPGTCAGDRVGSLWERER
jgi:hypothetical protein